MKTRPIALMLGACLSLPGAYAQGVPSNTQAPSEPRDSAQRVPTQLMSKREKLTLDADEREITRRLNQQQIEQAMKHNSSLEMPATKTGQAAGQHDSGVTTPSDTSPETGKPLPEAEQPQVPSHDAPMTPEASATPQQMTVPRDPDVKKLPEAVPEDQSLPTPAPVPPK
jgi:hypothetical protein